MQTAILLLKSTKKVDQLLPQSLPSVPHRRTWYQVIDVVCPIDRTRIEKRKYTVEAFQINHALL